MCVSVRVFTFRFLYYFIHYKCCVSSVHFFFFHLSHVNKRTRTISPSMLISFHIFLIYLYSPLLSSFLSLFLNVEHNVFFFPVLFWGEERLSSCFFVFFLYSTNIPNTQEENKVLPKPVPFTHAALGVALSVLLALLLLF